MAHFLTMSLITIGLLGMGLAGTGIFIIVFEMLNRSPKAGPQGTEDSKR